jgi:8-oxo-dGTP pyrophosphatase MutT (NUDIX family)
VTRSTRYQGAILREDPILLLKQMEHASGRSYWQIPGGGIEGDETEEQCVQRELLEETGLSVQVDSLLLDEPSTPGAMYDRWKTYRCSILAGEAHPGSAPEAAYADAYSFTEVGWFDLRCPATWNTRLGAAGLVYSWLQRVRVCRRLSMRISAKSSARTTVRVS